MTNYIGVPIPITCYGATSKLVPITVGVVSMPSNGTSLTNRGVFTNNKFRVGVRAGTKKGYTPTSPVTIVDVMMITGPRQFPLEIAWKRAATGN